MVFAKNSFFILSPKSSKMAIVLQSIQNPQIAPFIYCSNPFSLGQNSWAIWALLGILLKKTLRD